MMNTIVHTEDEKAVLLASSAFGEAIPGLAQKRAVDRRNTTDEDAGRGTKDEVIALVEQDLAVIGHRMCEYVSENQVSDIIFLDRAARPGYVVFTEMWKELHPDEIMPSLRFLNPLGFVSQSDISDGFSDWDEIQKAQAKDNSQLVNMSDLRTDTDIEAELGKYLEMCPLGDNVLLFDACLHTGRSIIPVRNHLQKKGVTTRLGIVNNVSNSSDIEPDFVALPGEATLHCVAFGVDTTCVKGLSSILPVVNPEREAHETSQNRLALRILTRAAIEHHSA
jgi:hypothetical protein